MGLHRRDQSGGPEFWQLPARQGMGLQGFDPFFIKCLEFLGLCDLAGFRAFCRHCLEVLVSEYSSYSSTA